MARTNEPSAKAVDLVVYGDFNCPFSAVASARASVLAARGVADIDWRAVEHDPDVVAGTAPMTDETRTKFENELEQIRGLLVDGEPDVLRVPPRPTNTRLATETYAACTSSERPALREQLFAAYWRDGDDLADTGLYERLGATRRDEVTATRWRTEWHSLTEPIVPVMVLPDGYVSRGLGALARLARLLP